MIDFSVEYAERPWTTNAERSGNLWQRASKTREWRTAFCLLTRQLKMPPLEWCEITVEPWLLNRRGMQDTGACHPSAKAAIDGLVDAELLDDDTPDIVRKLTFVAPRVGRNALVLLVTGQPK